MSSYTSEAAEYYRRENQYHTAALTESYNNKETSEVIKTSETGGRKAVKPIQLHALPWEALQELGRVYAFGATKYDDFNYARGYKWSLSFDALQRHLWAFWSGEENDPESRLHHLGHAMWHCATLLLFVRKEKYARFDDRRVTKERRQEL